MIGRAVAHFRIEERVGAGGMGEVFRARDVALGREAALKLLPPDHKPGLRARLLREAEACARLQHPAIATFYEAGEAEGVVYVAMEFVRGRTLRARLGAGALPLDESLAIAKCVLEALGHAHAAGILHRDIKPENIMVTGGRGAKLLDFGLAKHLLDAPADSEAATATNLTGVGFAVGTVGYMPPEQLQGGPVREPSDLFQVGAVLYETVTGLPAFPGFSVAERIAAILTRAPDLLALSGPGIPPGLPTVLARALAREPSRRYRSAAEFLTDLQDLGEGRVRTELPDTLAVMDLENLTGEPADNWLGSGIAESLAADLSRVPGLTVIAREKVLRTRSSPEGTDRVSDALDLGLRLGCRWVLSGAYQRLGSALRITARLTEVPTGRVTAAEKIDGRMEEIFPMQDRLSAAVAASLSLERPTPVAPAEAARPVDAYECYARARRLWLRVEKGSFDQARELYERAVAFDPYHAAALAGLAAVHCMRFTYTTDHADLARAREYADRALALDPGLGEAYIWKGYAAQRELRFEESIEAYRRARELDPENHFAWYFGGTVLLSAERNREALPLFQQAVEREPRNGFAWLAVGWTHVLLNQLPEGRFALGKAVELEAQAGPSPTVGGAGYLADCLRRMGSLEEARRQCLAGLEAVEGSDHMYRDTFRALCLCVLGRTAIEQDDLEAARAAFHQALCHLRGRQRALGGGQLAVQALAGLARAGGGAGPFDEALRLFAERQEHDFHFFYGCSDGISLLELARAARSVGRGEEARSLLVRARAAGSLEPFGDSGS